MMTPSATASAPLDAAIASVSEFPERLGPVLIKELRQGLRSGLFVLPFVILPAVLALVAVWALSIDNMREARNGVKICFWAAVLVPVLVITPLRALGTIRSERDAQTLDLLQLTPLTAGRIVFAKWSSLMAQALLWVIALLPFFVLRYFFGAMNLTDELLQLIWVVVCGGVLSALGLVVSTLPRLVFWLALAGMVFFGITGFWSLMVVSFHGASSGTIFGRGVPARDLLILVLMAGHVTYLALAFAASRIAPLADNYALRLRGGTLALFFWFGLASIPGVAPDRDVRWVFFIVAAVATTLFTAIDLTSARQPLLTHVRPWTRWGPISLFVGRAFMPGWSGAVVFFSAVTLGAVGIALLESGKGAELCAGALIFWPAVILPRALQCFFAPRSGERPALHLVLHLLGPLLAGTLAAFSFVLGGALYIPAAIFPSALWWLVVFDGYDLEQNFVTIGVIGAIWVLGLAAVCFYHSREYWAVMSRHAATARAARQVATSAP